jgi:hypothetical protein
MMSEDPDIAQELINEITDLRTRLAAAEEQLADANRGYSLLCDEEARLNDDLAAARRALDTAQEDARQGWASMHAVEQTAADAIMERDAVRRALEEATRDHLIALCALTEQRQREGVTADLVMNVQRATEATMKAYVQRALLAPERPR